MYLHDSQLTDVLAATPTSSDPSRSPSPNPPTMVQAVPRRSYWSLLTPCFILNEEECGNFVIPYIYVYYNLL